MAAASIPVDLYNPGQVFACLGFLEAADLLLGDAEGGFDWSDPREVTFAVRTNESENPFRAVLQFISTAEVADVEPSNWPAEHSPASVRSDEFPAALSALWDKQEKKWKRTALPIQIRVDALRVTLDHWIDGSSRNLFKLYSGNRSALGIAEAMLRGTRAKPKKAQNLGDPMTRGLADLFNDDPDALVSNPFNLTPMGGSFNFDPRGAWTAIDAGYSPNEHKHAVDASPVVEFLAAWGLEHARPVEFGIRQVRYAVWGVCLQPILARAALAGALATVPSRRFRFELGLAGKNKVVGFAQEEARP